jgi:hypothetical protein
MAHRDQEIRAVQAEQVSHRAVQAEEQVPLVGPDPVVAVVDLLLF